MRHKILTDTMPNFKTVQSYRSTVILVPFSYAGANDFSLLANEFLTIPSTAAVSTTVCHDITVPADMIVEDNETFTISVETSNPNNVIMGPSTATVTIVDNDGKHIEHGVIGIRFGIFCYSVY